MRPVAASLHLPAHVTSLSSATSTTASAYFPLMSYGLVKTPPCIELHNSCSSAHKSLFAKACCTETFRVTHEHEGVLTQQGRQTARQLQEGCRGQSMVYRGQQVPSRDSAMLCRCQEREHGGEARQKGSSALADPSQPAEFGSGMWSRLLYFFIPTMVRLSACVSCSVLHNILQEVDHVSSSSPFQLSCPKEK